MKLVEALIIDCYAKKGLNGVHAFLKRNKIAYKQEILEFGLHTKKGVAEEKKQAIESDKMTFHYYSKAVRGRNGYTYNVVRATKIVLL